MIPHLGPRIIKFRDEQGSVGSISIEIRPLPTLYVDLGGGEGLNSLRGEVLIASSVMSHRMELDGTDEIQLVYRLLWMADVWIQTSFRGASFEIFKIMPGDVKGDFDIYN